MTIFKGTRRNTFFYFTKQLIVSLVSGSAAVWVAYQSNARPTSVIKNVGNAFDDPKPHAILVAFLCSYLVAAFVKRYITTRDSGVKYVADLGFGAVKKLASGYENLLQAFAGFILISSHFWYFWEPQTFQVKLFIYYHVIACIFLLAAALFDQFDEKQ